VPSAEADAGRTPGTRGGTGAGADPSFRKVGEETVFRGVIFSVGHATFATAAGSEFDRDVVRHPGAVAVVPVTEEGEVVLLRQYRPAVERFILEVPAGTRDVDGEPPDETARRELAEEAGYDAGQLEFLAEILNTPGFCDESTRLYLATALAPVPSRRHGVEEETLTVERVALAAFDALVDAGEVVDAQTILGVGLARRRLAQAGRGDGV
jgi:ADP-ribose pyrophosphatase